MLRDEARRLQRLVDAGKDPRVEAAEQRAAHEARKAETRLREVTAGEARILNEARIDLKPEQARRGLRAVGP